MKLEEQYGEDVQDIYKENEQLKTRLDQIKEYALDRWVTQKMWDVLEKELGE